MFPRRHSSWELEFGDSGAIPGRGLLLTEERQTGGVWGRRMGREMPVEESLAPWNQGDTAESIKVGGAITIAPLSPPNSNQQLTSRQAGPSSTWLTKLQSRTPARGPFYMPYTLNNREGPQRREPPKCLNGESYGERLPKEASWSPSTRGWKKDR